jgi:hypothetical protein
LTSQVQFLLDVFQSSPFVTEVILGANGVGKTTAVHVAAFEAAKTRPVVVLHYSELQESLTQYQHCDWPLITPFASGLTRLFPELACDIRSYLKTVDSVHYNNKSSLPLLIIDEVLNLSNTTLIQLTRYAKQLNYREAMKIVLVSGQDRLDNLELLEHQRCRTPTAVLYSLLFSFFFFLWFCLFFSFFVLLSHFVLRFSPFPVLLLLFSDRLVVAHFT